MFVIVQEYNSDDRKWYNKFMFQIITMTRKSLLIFMYMYRIEVLLEKIFALRFSSLLCNVKLPIIKNIHFLETFIYYLAGLIKP